MKVNIIYHPALQSSFSAHKDLVIMLLPSPVSVFYRVESETRKFKYSSWSWMLQCWVLSLTIVPLCCYTSRIVIIFLTTSKVLVFNVENPEIFRSKYRNIILLNLKGNHLQESVCCFWQSVKIITCENCLFIFGYLFQSDTEALP